MRASIWTIISLLGWFLLWASLTYFSIVDPELVTPPWVIIDYFWQLVEKGYSGKALYVHFFISLWRTLLGFFIGAAMGVPLGLLMGMSRVAHIIFNPIITLLRPIPSIAFIPLVVLWFGIGEVSKITVIAASALLFISINTYEGVLQIPIGYKQVALNLGASRFQLFKRVIFPATSPAIMVGLKLGLAISLTVVVAAELIAAQAGLGYMIADAATFFRLPAVYIGVILIGVVGFALEIFITRIESRLIHWKGK